MSRFTLSALSIALLLTVSSPCLAQKEDKSNKIDAKSSNGKEKNTENIVLKQKPMERFEQTKPKDLPEIPFFDERGKARIFEDFYGKVVILNIWATWCAPCVEEMPAISKLQKDFKRKNVKVVAVSEDFKGAEEIRAFYKTYEITNLGIYMDQKNALFNALGIVGLPTSIIIDSNGKEVARAMGYIDWENPELRAFIDSLTDGKSYPPEEITLQPAPSPIPVEETKPVTPLPSATPPEETTPAAPAPQASTPLVTKSPVAPPTPAEKIPADLNKILPKRFQLPPEAITTPPANSINIDNSEATTQKIDVNSPQYNVRRPANQPISIKNQ